mmetsp:Transcript_27104/g.33051  ORF Transcript_27104/g.33051 Transcript_27104/m.33051 type:complete len:180 (+) Transcript_27104:39-578(+)
MTETIDGGQSETLKNNDTRDENNDKLEGIMGFCSKNGCKLSIPFLVIGIILFIFAALYLPLLTPYKNDDTCTPLSVEESKCQRGIRYAYTIELTNCDNKGLEPVETQCSNDGPPYELLVPFPCKVNKKCQIALERNDNAWVWLIIAGCIFVVLFCVVIIIWKCMTVELEPNRDIGDNRL